MKLFNPLQKFRTGLSIIDANPLFRKILTIFLFLFLCFFPKNVLFAQCDNYLDYFNSVSYANNDGNASFIGNWIEGNDDNNPATGNVFIESGLSQVVFQQTTVCRHIERTVDLSTAPYVDAIFSLQYDLLSVNGPANDLINIQVSPDGGANFTNLETLDGNAIGQSVVYYDLNPYIGTNPIIRIEVCGFGDSSERVELVFANVYACEEAVFASNCSSLTFDWENAAGVGEVWNPDDQSNNYVLTDGSGNTITATVNLIDPANRNSESDIRDAGNHPFDPVGGCEPYPGSTEADGWPANDGSIVDPWDSDCSPLWTQTAGAYGPNYLTWVINSGDHEDNVTLEFCFSSPVLMENFLVSDIDYNGFQWTVNNSPEYETPGNSFQDEIYAYALDANMDTVDITIVPSGTGVTVNSSPTIEQAIAVYDTNQFGDLSPNDPNGEVSITSDKAISCLYLIYSNGIDDALEEQANAAAYSWWSNSNGATNGVSDDQAIRVNGFNACVCTPFQVAIQNDTVCLEENGTILIGSIGGGVPPYTFLWGDVSGTTSDSISFSSTSPELYNESVLITDGQGCTDTLSGFIEVIKCCDPIICLPFKMEINED